jgi:hypothetical protein
LMEDEGQTPLVKGGRGSSRSPSTNRSSGSGRESSTPPTPPGYIETAKERTGKQFQSRVALRIHRHRQSMSKYQSSSPPLQQKPDIAARNAQSKAAKKQAKSHSSFTKRSMTDELKSLERDILEATEDIDADLGASQAPQRR